jgi:hypothetical protein
LLLHPYGSDISIDFFLGKKGANVEFKRVKPFGWVWEARHPKNPKKIGGSLRGGEAPSFP